MCCDPQEARTWSCPAVSVQDVHAQMAHVLDSMDIMLRVDCEIDSVSLDGSAGISGDGVSVALDVEPGADRNEARIYRHDAITSQEARVCAAMKVAAIVIRIVDRSDHGYDSPAGKITAGWQLHAASLFDHFGDRLFDDAGGHDFTPQLHAIGSGIDPINDFFLAVRSFMNSSIGAASQLRRWFP